VSFLFILTLGNVILFLIPLGPGVPKSNKSNTKDPFNGDGYSYLMEVLTGVILSDGSLVKKKNIKREELT